MEGCMPVHAMCLTRILHGCWHGVGRGLPWDKAAVVVVHPDAAMQGDMLGAMHFWTADWACCPGVG